ncbi:ATP-grasp domain-containing protein [Texcoconibacillus texcoconensis]|uniref:RimK family alpha-L-glutamate ligase n=1 Tax=Texcoconibacillus texcoconensis TaxID=1095777 RepID=A0A840QSR0_9BACI|nr:hypothetical protein [Texcoconibacillus texcoconensis]MBB5174405.1 RimK family alpha-L-glutamate ligase [Texcoconibacillus texcoconensis]
MTLKNQTGWLIYPKQEAKRNQFFINQLQQAASNRGGTLHLIDHENIQYQDDKSHINANAPLPTYVLNRSLDDRLASVMERKDIRVFNPASVSYIANHKARAAEFAAKLDIPMLDFEVWQKQDLNKNAPPRPYPFVIKDVYGRGGTSVWLVENIKMWHSVYEQLPDLVISQPLGPQPGKDVRVFVVGGHVVAAVLRQNEHDFKSNISLGGTSELYKLTRFETNMTENLAKSLNADYVSIDYIFDEHGGLLFNEIEDAAGARSLYQNSDINIAEVFIDHVEKTLSTM